MVCSGKQEMAMVPKRSKLLHNFNLPCSWGSHMYLKCMNVDDASTATDSSSAAAAAASDHLQPRRSHGFQRRRSSPSKFESLVFGGMRRRELESSPSNKESRMRIPKGESAEGIEAVREKIMKDLKTAADKMKDAIFRDEVSDDDDDEDEFEDPKLKVKEKEKNKEKEREESLSVEFEARPWNLRTRRAACKAPIIGGGTNNNFSSSMKNEVIKSPKLRDRGATVASSTVAAAAAEAEKKRPRPKFSVPLSKKEVEDDFMAMTGYRPVRRPKKRPRNVQRQLDVSSNFILFLVLCIFFPIVSGVYFVCFWVAVAVVVSRIMADGGDGRFLQGSGAR